MFKGAYEKQAFNMLASTKTRHGSCSKELKIYMKRKQTWSKSKCQFKRIISGSSSLLVIFFCWIFIIEENI